MQTWAYTFTINRLKLIESHSPLWMSQGKEAIQSGCQFIENELSYLRQFIFLDMTPFEVRAAETYISAFINPAKHRLFMLLNLTKQSMEFANG